MKSYITVKQSNIHFITKFGRVGKWQTYAISTKTTPHFSALIPSLIFTGNLLVSLKRASLLMMRWECRLADGQSYCRCSEWPPLQPQPHRQSGTWWRSPPPCSRVLKASLPKWSAERLSSHQLSYASAGVYDTFPAWCPRCDSPNGFKSGELEGHSVFSMFAFSQFCMTLTHW